MITIYIYITKYNTVIIDPQVVINTDSLETYKCHFEFQVEQPADMTFYAIFKPVCDVPVQIKLDENNECFIPRLRFNKYLRLGIGLRGIIRSSEGTAQQVATTDLRYIRVRDNGICTIQE